MGNGCGMAAGKTAGSGSPNPPSCACFMQIPASESLHALSFFPHRRGKFWPDFEKRPIPCACDRVGVVGGRVHCHFCSLW